MIAETWNCKTEENLPCVFPFRYEDKWHYGCIPMKDALDSKPRCPTATDKCGYFKSHAICQATCPGGKICIM